MPDYMYTSLCFKNSMLDRRRQHSSGRWHVQAPAPSDFEANAEAGEVVGLITIEDVVETLIGDEILDETDRYVDNERTQRVDSLELPERLQAALGTSSSQLQRAMSSAGWRSAVEEPLLRGAFSDGGDSRADSSPRSDAIDCLRTLSF